MSLLRQTTLFGKVAKQAPDVIYANPTNTYEAFVERWYQRERKRSNKSKQELVKEAQVSELSVGVAGRALE